MAPQERAYGTWDSPITLDLLCQGFVSIDSPRAYNDNIYYIESRSDGRNTLIQVSRQDKQTDSATAGKEILPSQHSIGTSVHEYGGGALAIHRQDGHIIFSDQKDHGVYILDPTSGTVTSVAEQEGWRFGDFESHPNGLILAVREVHDVSNDVPETVKNELVLLDPKGGQEPYVLLTGTADFYSQARFSPDGKKLCWLQWSHPEMPWTGAVLYSAEFDEQKKALVGAKAVAGTGHGNGISQPRWGPDGSLFFADDKTGYWQLSRVQPGSDAVEDISIKGLEQTDQATAEFRLASYTYIPMSAEKLVLIYIKDAISHVVEANLTTKTYRDLDVPVVDSAYDSLYPISSTEFLVIGATMTKAQALYKVNISSPKAEVTIVRESLKLNIDTTHLSIPQVVSCPRTQGDYKEGQVHGFYMPPTNPDFTAPANTLPPLLVYAHGGPTGHYKPNLYLEGQYWTSRGYGVYLCNYAGSTGYGRKYRQLLNGRWGLLDGADCASAAAHLASEGLVDALRLGVVGPSAGGYVVLKTVCDQPSVWAAGVSLFGPAELKTFNATTHKFESHYAEGLMYGDDPDRSEERVERVNFERSPVCHVDNVKAPVLLLQGDQDKVVPPAQSEMMLKALKEHGTEAELIIFEGEGHTIWRGEAQRRSITAQERWWKTYLVRA